MKLDGSTLIRLLAVTVVACVVFAWWEVDLSLETIEEYNVADVDVSEVHCPRGLPVDIILSADATNAHGALATINSIIDSSASSACSLARLRIFFFTTPQDMPLYTALFAATNSTFFQSLHLYPLPDLDIPQTYKVSNRFMTAERDLTASPNFVRLFIDKVTDVANLELVAQGRAPISRVLWLDTDVVVLRDIVPVFDSVLRGSRTAGPVMATSITNDPHGYRVMFSRHTTLTQLVPAVEPCLNKTPEAAASERFCPHFNAGVMFLHVERWRSLGVSTLATLLLQANAQLIADNARLWDHVSNPPLVLLALLFGVEEMSVSPQLHFRLDNLTPKEIEKLSRAVDHSLPMVIHYNGDTKPWMPSLGCESWSVLSFFKQHFIGYGCPFAHTEGAANLTDCRTLRPLGVRRDVQRKKFRDWCRGGEISPEEEEAKRAKKAKKQQRRRAKKAAAELARGIAALGDEDTGGSQGHGREEQGVGATDAR